jgi:fluoroacetyl-CoA thioesterase
MPEPIVPVGLRYTKSIEVSEALTVPAVSSAFTGFQDMPPVFATAFLVGFIEWTCIEALRAHLGAGQLTVGTHVDVSHVAATPVGMTVTAAVEVVEVDGRRLRFAVECRDDKDVISRGFHERAVIDGVKFKVRLAAKSGG